MLLAQLTDTHILEPGSNDDHLLDNSARLAAAVERLGQETVKPRAVLATGDLTDHGTEAEMAMLMDLLAPIEVPILAVPGNHDVRETFAPAFDLPWASATNLSWVVDLDDLRVVGLDTIVAGSHAGLFDDERRDWLTGALDEADGRRVLIAMHHAPFLSGIGWMDRTALEGRDAFAQVVSGRPNIERIVCGHLHRPQVTTISGVTASVGISTAQHIELDLADDAPVGIICDPGGYHLHHHQANEDGSGTWVSHIRFIETGAEVVRPSWST